MFHMINLTGTALIYAVPLEIFKIYAHTNSYPMIVASINTNSHSIKPGDHKCLDTMIIIYTTVCAIN